MGLLDALKQYLSDAAPGGLLNQEWTPENVRTAGEAMSMVPNPAGDVASGLLAVDDLRKGNYGDAALNGLGLLPFVPAMGGVIGKHHSDILGRLKTLPDNLIDASFGHSGNVYATPLRPFENAQAKQIGGGTPIAERLFSTTNPLDSKAMQSIEALPISDSALNAFAKELASEGAMAMHNGKGKMTVVMPSTKGKGFQMTEFDTKGAIGDAQFLTKEEAIRRMIDAGYSKILDESQASKIMNKLIGL